MFPDDRDALRRRMIIGGAAVVGIIYLMLLHVKLKSPGDGYLVGIFLLALLFALKSITPSS